MTHVDDTRDFDKHPLNRTAFDWAISSGTPGGRRIVLIAIAYYSDGKNECCRTVSQLGWASGRSDRAVQMDLRWLEDNCYIQRQIGGGRVPTYRLLIDGVGA